VASWVHGALTLEYIVVVGGSDGGTKKGDGGDSTPRLSYADMVTRAEGGRGSVREVINLILKCQGKLQVS
jgi:hypothetical protein